MSSRAAARLFWSVPTSVQPVISYQSVSFSYQWPDASVQDAAGRESLERAMVLRDVTLDVLPGERLGILGPNGGGKSTLLKLTLGLLQGHKGQILVCGMPPREARRAGRIGYVPQKIEAELGSPLTVLQVVRMAASISLPAWKGLSAEANKHVLECLNVVGAAALADRSIGELSGGQVQRVMIARALAPRPAVLLLDEPTVGIDVVGQQQFAELLSSLRAWLGVTIVVVSHDLRTVAAGCDRVACLSRTLHAHTDPRGLTPEVLGEVFRHDVAAIFGDVHVHAHPASECAHHHDANHMHDAKHTPVLNVAGEQLESRAATDRPRGEPGR
ncbi:MAG: metal ABC transporter ATP-binding protein [Planctomycetota bacterium]|nr:metal ABC transporter ATP-binding protein [Planctomycetota bacterium]